MAKKVDSTLGTEELSSQQTAHAWYKLPLGISIRSGNYSGLCTSNWVGSGPGAGAVVARLGEGAGPEAAGPVLSAKLAVHGMVGARIVPDTRFHRRFSVFGRVTGPLCFRPIWS